MDNILITMPKDPREFFLAMPVIQDYIYQFIQEVHFRSRGSQYRFVFRMNDAFEQYEAPLKVAKDNVPQFDYTGWTVKNRSEFDCFIDFDFPAAEKISRTTGKHITESLGILIGSRPRKWPILPPPRCTEGKGILILNWDESPLMDKAIKVQKALGKDTNAANITYPATMQDIELLDIDTISGIIGPASALTHLAASYNRKMVEIFPGEISYNLYNNEGIPEYQAVIGSSITADIILTAWNSLSHSYDELEVISAE